MPDKNAQGTWRRLRIVGDRGITWGDTPASNMLREVSVPYVEQDDL